MAFELKPYIEPTDQKTLQKKFRRDPQIKIKPKRLVTSREGPCRRPACDRLQHRSLHFHKTAIFQKTANLTNNQETFGENRARLIVRDQIKVTLAISRLNVLQAMPFFW